MNRSFFCLCCLVSCFLLLPPSCLPLCCSRPLPSPSPLSPSLLASFPALCCLLLLFLPALRLSASCDTERTNATHLLVKTCQLPSSATVSSSVSLPVLLPRFPSFHVCYVRPGAAACTSRQLLPHQLRCVRHLVDKTTDTGCCNERPARSLPPLSPRPTRPRRTDDACPSCAPARPTTLNGSLPF